MARVSKKVSAAQREAENAPHRIWKTAIYARLSDFDDVLRDTESLEVQISSTGIAEAQRLRAVCPWKNFKRKVLGIEAGCRE